MNMQSSFVKKRIDASARIKLKMAESEVVEAIKRAAEYIVQALRLGGKVLLCGNGGSAADSQHIAAELVGRFKLDRNPLAAVALTTDSSILTSVGNDYGYHDVFRRQVEALGKKGDVLIGITTSGSSKNVILAMRAAKEKGMITVGLIGEKSEAMKDIADVVISIPSKETPRIQEAHILVGHIICEFVERFFFEKD